MTGVILNSIAFSTYLYFGFYIFFLDKKNKTNFLFFIVCMIYSVWSFSFIFINMPALAESEKLIWLKIGYTAAYSYNPVVLVFALHFSGFFKRIRLKWLFLAGLAVVPGIYLFMHLIHNAIIRDMPFGFWFISSHIYANLYNCASIIIVIIGAVKNGSQRMRRQVAIIVCGAVIAIAVTLFTDFYMGNRGIPTLTPALLSIWIGSVWFALVRFRLLAVNQRLMNAIVSRHIDEVIVFTDMRYIIRMANEKLLFLMKKTYAQINGVSLFTVFNDEKLQKSCAVLQQRKQTIIQRKCHLKGKHPGGTLLNMRIQLVQDKYGDDIGFVLVGKEVRGFERLKSVYRLSSREIEVVRCVMTGNTNKEIATRLFISERTVKAHLTHIYNKMGIDNKVQMLNVVFEGE
ncbi:MAG: hypothetical protein JW904_00940 [Spirochaetales bacterium]|nr:hypothetical protein [Spirochaetales bacterium]